MEYYEKIKQTTYLSYSEIWKETEALLSGFRSWAGNTTQLKPLPGPGDLSLTPRTQWWKERTVQCPLTVTHDTAHMCTLPTSKWVSQNQGTLEPFSSAVSSNQNNSLRTLVMTVAEGKWCPWWVRPSYEETTATTGKEAINSEPVLMLSQPFP